MVPPADVTVGEIYRLLVRLEEQVKDLNIRLESKMVTLDVYQIAHKQLQDDLSSEHTALESHLVHHDMDDRERKQIRVALVSALCVSSVSFLVGIGGIIVGLVR